MTRFYLEDYQGNEHLMDCQIAAHVMRNAVNDLNHDNDSDMNWLHVEIMDYFLAHSYSAVSVSKIVRALKGEYGWATEARIEEAITELRKARFLRKGQRPDTVELAYLSARKK